MEEDTTLEAATYSKPSPTKEELNFPLTFHEPHKWAIVFWVTGEGQFNYFNFTSFIFFVHPHEKRFPKTFP